MPFTYDEVRKASLEFFNGDELAAETFAGKYALQDLSGLYHEKTPADMHRRMAKEFARVELKYPNPVDEETIYRYFSSWEIVPQGSPMSGIGNPYQLQSLGNCFVIPSAKDSYGGILFTDQQQVHIMKRRGGVGHDISTLRPRGATTNNAARTTDGIGIFMERFSNTTREVAQSGRRGALMLSISVHHPEIMTFIKIKNDKTKVTGANISVRVTDEFMRAVKSGEKYHLRFPVDSSAPQIEEWVDARSVWNEIMQSAWSSAEPGVLFWDTIIKESPADCYADVGYGTTSTNPCFSGDTLIAVADGRNAVSIKQLADEGRDVPLYSMDKSGMISIKTGRHPRVTGCEQKLVRVHLDNGTHLDVTPNHTFILMDGAKVEAKSLKPGDSLPRFTKRLESVKKGGNEYYRVALNTRNPREKQVFEHRLIAQFHNPELWSSVYDKAKNSGWAVTGGLVVHHKDYNPVNNSPENLEIMTFREHTKLHASADTQGEKNGRAYTGVSNDYIVEMAKKLTINFGRRFSRKEWSAFAKKNGLPVEFSSWRSQELGSVLDLAKKCALEVGFDADADPRLVETLNNMADQGYVARICCNEVLVEKTCEHCAGVFEISHSRREQGYCGVECALKRRNADIDFHKNRTAKTKATYAKMAVDKRIEQARIYSALKFELGRVPLISEWEDRCRLEKVPYRIGKKLKNGFKNFKEVAESGDVYNHKVISVEELSGRHTVYNITVDDNHTLAVVTSNRTVGKVAYDGVITAQCGELPLSPGDSCRLMLLNLLKFVTNPFTPKASFDYTRFAVAVRLAQRLMDDMVDLELEVVNKIILKVMADPEPDEIKAVELNTWREIQSALLNGRRTGLGITALGDTLAALGIKYGDDQSVAVTEKIYKALAVSSYSASIIMAEERGAFKVFDKKKEKEHPFIGRVLGEMSPDMVKRYNKYGRRNIANLTTAPAGSVSILTQTTSGCEPVFLLGYKRRRKINPSDKQARVDFVDQLGDRWQEYVVYHPGLYRWSGVTGIPVEDSEKSPYFGATSDSIDWVKKVEIQAAAQKWVDHAISNTTNLPNKATVEDVSAVYMRGWETGCKGITVYRDGSRSGVLVSVDADNSGRNGGITETMAPKRPAELRCDIHRASVKGTQYLIAVGLMGDRPYEIFAGLSENVDIGKEKTGKLIRSSKSVYDLVLDDGVVVTDIINKFDNPNYGAFTRTLSTALRHGVPVKYIVEQLRKDKHSDLTSFSAVIARVFAKSYIPDGTKGGSHTCSECGSTSLAYQEGCLACLNCGYSKCG